MGRTKEKVVESLRNNKELLEECRGKTLRMVKYNKDLLLNGTMLAIDPGSVKSGWALFKKGELLASGDFKTKSRPPLLRMKEIREFYSKFREVDILAMEYIHEPNGKTVMSSYTKLLKSVGALAASVDFTYCLEIAPIVWQDVYSLKQGRKTKSDESDAMGVGKALVIMARELDTEDIPKVKAKAKTKTKTKVSTKLSTKSSNKQAG